MATNVDRLHGKAQLLPFTEHDGYVRHASMVLWTASALLLLGTIVDLGILWVFQRQPGPQWEFVALVNTLEAFPRIVIAIGMAYVALAVRPMARSSQRLLAVALLVLGLTGAALAGLLVTDYLALSSLIAPESLAVFQSTVAKGVALGGLYAVLVPVGIIGLRTKKAAR